MTPSPQSRIQGALYGALVGDALGAPYEFKDRDSYDVSYEMENVAHFKLDAGSYTDDGAMLLCTCYSLLHSDGLDPTHLMNTFLDWFLKGFLSVNGRCFDIGNSTRMALLEWNHRKRQGTGTISPFTGSRLKMHSGNGGLMRLAPLVLWDISNASGAIDTALNGVMTTHASSICIDTARLMAIVLVRFMYGHTKQDVLGTSLGKSQVKETKELFEGKFRDKKREEIETGGYAIHSLEAALWALWHTETFEDGMKMLLTMGDDVDTVCCIYGQIAGAYYGIEAVPQRWVTSLQNKQQVDELISAFTERVQITRSSPNVG